MTPADAELFLIVALASALGGLWLLNKILGGKL
jgi:hypothetical protein